MIRSWFRWLVFYALISGFILGVLDSPWGGRPCQLWGISRVTSLMEIVCRSGEQKKSTHQESKLTQERHWWRCEQSNLRKSTRWNTCFNHGGKNQTPWSLNKTTSQGELAPNYPGAGGLLSSMTRLCWAGLSIGPMQHLNEALLVEVSVAILMQHSLQIVTPKKCWWTGDFEILC